MPDSLQELKDLYEEADRFAREIGEFRSDVSIPAHNELRYAGHHVLQAIGDSGEIDGDQIQKAKNHCERAMYEAAEAGITYALDWMDKFDFDYRDIVIVEVVTDYAGMRQAAYDAQDLLVRGRSQRNSVVEHARMYMAAFHTLKKAVKQLKASQGDLSAKVMSLKRENRRFVITCLLLLLGAVVAAVVGAAIILLEQQVHVPSAERTGVGGPPGSRDLPPLPCRRSHDYPA